MNLTERNQKIIAAVIERAGRVCPGSLALIGVYGSFATGDVHEKSDLDLLILINDERGRQLSAAFIQDDLSVGHDLYCTTWDSLAAYARYEHPHIAKLMDSVVVYCADESSSARLEALRSQARAILSAPLSEKDLAKAESQLREAELCCMNALTAQTRPEALNEIGGMLYYAENAVALLNKRYFRLGVRRIYEELSAMPLRPENLCERIEALVSAGSTESLRENALLFIRELRECFKEARLLLPFAKNPPAADALRDTYEEMFSNWRNKMYLAAGLNNRHLSFMSLASLNAMMADIAADTDVGSFDLMGAYDPQDLTKTAESFDEALNRYRLLYRQVGLQEARYPDVEAFLREYMK